jgi:hypothetical protein
MTTVVQYHADGIEDPRPAIDVKDRHAGSDYWPRLPMTRSADGTVFPALPAGRMGVFVDLAYGQAQRTFWATAEEVAASLGLGPIAQEGRSGGWLVFTDGRDPQRMEQDGVDLTVMREWLSGYRSMKAWSNDFLHDAPRRVREHAQQLAMDAAGHGAAARMFAFDLTAVPV